MRVPNVAELDADIGEALLGAGVLSMVNVFDKWAKGMTEPERRELARYISERIHDVLLDRVRRATLGPPSG